MLLKFFKYYIQKDLLDFIYYLFSFDWYYSIFYYKIDMKLSFSKIFTFINIHLL